VTVIDPPVGIERQRHLELHGRGRYVWVRRMSLLVVAAVPVLALLDVFGQGAVVNGASTRAVSMSVNSPAHVRGGVIFTTQITVRAHDAIHDMQLTFARGWFQGMTFNGVAPQPSNESSEDGRVVYDYGSVPAGTTYRIWVSWQTNPTNVGRHPQDVMLADGQHTLLTVHRTITVFP
jgi:hypothetical protein